MSGRCALCDCALTEGNDTDEHIIPNAIGGRKKVRGFICRTCNSVTGSEWDDELAKLLNPLSIHLGIRRQRGKVPSQIFQTAKGQSIRVNSDGSMTPAKPEVTVTNEEDRTSIRVVAPSRKELRQALVGLQRKYPQLRDADVDEFMREAKDNLYYSPDPLKISPEFDIRAGRSLVKSTVALVFDADIDTSQCDLALDYLRSNDGEPCFGYYYVRGRDLVINRPAKSPFHCVHVIGCSSDSTLLGYVEFYGLWRMVLCLSETYTGEGFSHTYTIDPVSGSELDVAVNMDLSVSEIREAYEYKHFDNTVFEEAMSDVMDTVMEAGFRRELDRASERAITAAYAKSGVVQGDPMTEELAWRLAKDIVAELQPFIIHNLTQSAFPEDKVDEE